MIDPRELFFLSCSTVSAAHALQGSSDSIAWSTIFTYGDIGVSGALAVNLFPLKALWIAPNYGSYGGE